MSDPILPGATLGMLGGGQLGRMSLLAGRQMGYRFAVLEPKAPCSAGAVAEEHFVAPYHDAAALARFAAKVQVATLEFENIPAATLDALEGKVAVRPGRQALRICQNRAREKAFLSENGFPCAPHALVESLEQLQEAAGRIGFPCVLKTADFGYDGKGQQRLESEADLPPAWESLAGERAVLEGWVDFLGEYSVICGRNSRGEQCAFPLLHNTHCNHILHTSTSPAGLDPALEKAAVELAAAIADQLDLVGLVAVELFLTPEGWLVNELAPRPHNSGHLTIDGHFTSQFEQHVRLVCGLAPGATDQHTPACMLNLIGTAATPPPELLADLLAEPRAKLHLYDKGEARPGRKMGHVTFLADRVATARQLADEWDQRLSAPQK
ncbi:MAG: 5-(carboxyamino)imidazole ribonucleotide synthase [Verrucomicrobia bacterium]|jgi:5-(carboxyamino)imidazole ribonucleotide synthase|nr:5-(carboxyamino)imidazole ribonucleotide synthase [Verrucomicrobiota bacterium]